MNHEDTKSSEINKTTEASQEENGQNNFSYFSSISFYLTKFSDIFTWDAPNNEASLSSTNLSPEKLEKDIKSDSQPEVKPEILYQRKTYAEVLKSNNKFEALAEHEVENIPVTIQPKASSIEPQPTPNMEGFTIPKPRRKRKNNL
ncbi:MAG: hypothetical protein JWM09_1056 [Francisellaceae bacterium]|nr:hypothetical protein [Francisellaceae bacterium]